MKKKVLLMVSPLPFFAAVALAGYAQPAHVTLGQNDDGTFFANGDLVTARYADNKVEGIGCGSTIWTDGEGGFVRFGFCQATNANDEYVVCETEDPALVEQIRAISDSSFIGFRYN